VIRRTVYVEFAARTSTREHDDLVARVVDGTRARDGVLAVTAAPPLEGSVLTSATEATRAADLMLLVALADDAAADAASVVPENALAGHRIVADVIYRQQARRVTGPDLRDGIHRSLLLRVEDDAPAELVARFETQLAAMGEYIDAIRNSSLSRVTEDLRDDGWTHVWEQEFDALAGLQGPYMLHPYHWAVVDAWFDDETNRRIVDRRLLHSFCPLPESLLRLDPAPDAD
jgi:Stress responsive A/B Barrel Domain